MTEAGTAPSLSDRLGWRSERRPVAGFANVLAAGAGFFLVVAAVALSIEIASDDLTAPGVIASLIVAGVALVIGSRLPGPARSASVTALATITPLLWFFVFFGNGSPDGDGATRGILILCLVVYGALYLLGWTAGRAIFLGLALIFLAGWINFEVAGGNAVAPFQTQVSSGTGFDTPFGSGGSSTGFNDNRDDGTAEDAVSMLIGLGFLAAAASLDRKGRSGTATPFLAVGAVFAVAGAASLGGQESVQLASLLAAGAGAAVGFVGSRSPGRRGSIWIGVLVVVIGLLVTIGDLANSTLGLAGLAALVAAALGGAGIVLAPKFAEPIDGDGAATG